MRRPLLAALLAFWCAVAGSAELPERVEQGQLVVAKAQPGERVFVGRRRLRVSADGDYAFGVARDAEGEVIVRTVAADGTSTEHRVRIIPRDWPVERIDGLPPKSIDPPPAIAARIAREQARVAETRKADSTGTGFTQTFLWPVQGRISGRFGSERRYNGRPGSPHSGMDIAAPSGTPVRAPVSGRIIFADADLYLTGGTLVIDHGHGVSSVFIHLSRIDVNVGDSVEQGEVVAAVGATGRATGPHLHWGMNWFDMRLDPQLVVTPRSDAP